MLNAVVESYNERWISDRNKAAMSTSRFIEDRLRNIESELNTVESNITDYQSRQPCHSGYGCGVVDVSVAEQ